MQAPSGDKSVKGRLASRLAELGIADPHHEARTVFAQVVIAYTVLGHPERRVDYLKRLDRSVTR